MDAVKLAKNLVLWSVDRLKPYDRNARTHSPEQVDQIAASIAEFGFTNPILVDTSDGIIAGHGRLMAAQKLGLTEVPVVVLDHLTDAQRRAYILADNKLALNAGWDENLLADELRSLDAEGFDLGLTGFSDDELADLLPEVDVLEPQSDEDDVPDALPEPKVVRGEVYILGKHRLMCGDSTAITDVDRLINGNKADMVFTDPPYNIDYSPEDRVIGGRARSQNKLGKIQNDSMSDDSFYDFLVSVNASIASSCKEGAAVYQCAPIDLNNLQYLLAWRDSGMHYSDGLIWVKNNHSISRKDYHPKHEVIHYGWLRGSHKWYGDRNKFSVYECGRDKVTEYVHPTQKPVALSEFFITNSSAVNEVVLDLFGGSGSTLIACEKSGRSSRIMELDPKYCSIILDRWQKYTGKKAYREDGKSWDEIKAV